MRPGMRRRGRRSRRTGESSANAACELPSHALLLSGKVTAGPTGRRFMNRSFLRLIAVAVFLGFLVAPGTGAIPESELRVPLRLTAPVPALNSVDDGDRLVPRIQGFGLTSRPGEPMLPLKVLMVAIPEGAIPELVVVSAESKLLPGRVSIAPVPRAVARGRLDDPRGAPGRGRASDPGVSDILRDRELAFTPDPGIYGADRQFPESPLRLGKIGYLREQRFVEVLFMPILYNPARGEARHVQEVRAEVRFKTPPGTRLAEVSRTYRPDPQFEDIYRASLLNYEQGKLFRVGRGETGQATATPTALPLSTVSQATTVPGSSRYKISVSTTGIYRLDYQYLQVNAPDLLAVDPRTLTLSAEGVEVPMSIRNAAGDSGEADGRFDAGDFLEFIGRSKAEPPALLNYDFTGVFPAVYEANDFTDTQIYWLSAADPAGSHLRIPSASGALQTPAFTTATDFEDAAVWDENNLYLPLGDADPFFSIPSLLAGSAQATRDLILPLPGIAPGATTTSVKVRLRGGSDLSIAPDHRTQVWVNGASTRGIDFTWDGEVIEEQEFAVARSDLSDPTTIHLSAPGIAGVNVDSQYPDSVTIRYRRLFSAINDLLPFTYPNQDARFQVSGFSGAAPTIYDVSRNLAGSGEGDPVRITGAVVSGSPGSTYTFDVPRDTSSSAPAVRSFMVAGPGGVHLPAGIVRASVPTLHDPQNAADFLVIASRDTVDMSPGGALQALLDHRLLTQGLTSKTVFIDQIYDEFSYGLRDANAIRSFLAYAFDNWRGPSGAAPPPSYVLLVGDGVVDYKNTLNRSDWVDQVPTPIMFQQSSILGYYSSDNWIASFRGNDQVPDVYIGRISTRSAAESAGVFNKILRYEQSPPPGLWKGHAVLVAGDGKFTGEAQSFEAVEDSLASSYFSAAPYTVPNPPLYFAEAPWNTMGAGAFKNALVSQLQGGAVFLSFVGHGSFDVWGLDTFFTAQDASAMNNDGSLPFMININCLSGGFHYLQGSGSLGEAMTNNPAGGAIATLAPSGLSNVFVGDAFNDLFASLFGPARERGLGKVTAALRAKLWSLGMVVDLQSYTLLGDPATPIAIPSPAPPSGLQAVAGNGQVSLSWSAPTEQVAGYRIYRATSSPAGQYQAITCDAVSATSCIDRSVVNATTYYYYSTSTDSEGFSGRASNFNSDCDAGPDCVV